MAATARTLESEGIPTTALRLVPEEDGGPGSVLLHTRAGDALVLASLPVGRRLAPRPRTVVDAQGRIRKEQR